MSETSNDWDERLSRLRKEKHEIGLPLAEVRQVEAYLKSKWDIAFQSHEDWEDRLCELPDELGEEFVEVMNSRADLIADCLPVPPQIEKKFYDLLSHPDINGIMHSQKTVCILGGLVWVTAVIQRLGLSGSLLDLGCHTGYQSQWYAEHMGLDVTGVDFSLRAIDAAKDICASNGSLEFLEWDISYPFPRQQTFDIVVCSDILGEYSEQSNSLIELVSDRLNDDGVFISIGNEPMVTNAQALQREASKHDLQFGVCDVIGGFDGDTFGGKPVLLLTKRKGLEVPEDISRQFFTGWETTGFPDFANSTIPPSEKSLAYFRAYNIEKSGTERS